MNAASPFDLHRRGFELESSGDLVSAEPFYRDALDGFAAMIRDPRFRRVLFKRASTIPGVDAGGVVEEFMKRLPGWLLEVHFERAARAISRRDLEGARLHWRILLSAEGLAGAAGKDYVQGCRGRLVERFLKPSQLESGMEQRAQYLRTAERLLRVDPDLSRARMMAARVYMGDLERNMEKVRSGSRGRKSSSETDRDLFKVGRGSLHRMRSELRKISQRLRRHLKRLGRSDQADPLEMAMGYVCLSRYYWNIGDRTQSVRMARRAKRLQPRDETIRRLNRAIQGRRRSGS